MTADTPPPAKKVSNAVLIRQTDDPRSPYSEATMRDICDRVAAGFPLTRLLRDRSRGYPSLSTFWRWIADNPSAAKMWEAARELAGHTYAVMQAEIAEDVRKKRLTPDQARVMLSAYQWLSGKFTPRHYSDRFAQLGGLQLIINTTLDLGGKHSGQDLSQPNTYTLTAVPVGEGDPPEGSHQVPAEVRGSHRLGRVPKIEKLKKSRKNKELEGEK